MAKYKVGDRVRIVKERPASPAFANEMAQYLGKTMTVSKVEERLLGTVYQFVEAQYPAYILPIVKIIWPNTTGMWAFSEEWIAGPAEPQAERHGDNDLRVVIRFHGNETTAELLRGKTIVKTATARRNPGDKYSHAKGAALAVERLFEKKSTGKAKEASKPKIGDKFVVTGNSSPNHYFNVGDIVTLTYPCENTSSLYRNECGKVQAVSDLDVKPYKGESK